MRDQPQPIGDPYRVLGLQPGATMAEVKRAYRKLAKAYHPDSAGEQALPRFLAIHEAYDALVKGRSRAGGGPRPARASSTAAPASEPWRADPERARAARERARAGRGATGSRPRSDAPGGAGRARTGTTGTGTGTTGTAGAKPGGSGTREGRRRNVRKATLGSTSYDEARDSTDATWSGASWYGPSSGEYWIVNPREYADPRKHGPTYQQRARRQAAAGAAGADAEAEPAVDAEPEQATATADSASWTQGAAREARDARDAGDARRWSGAARPEWTSASDPGAAASDRAWREAGRRMPGDEGPPAAFDSLGALGGVGRELLGGPTDDPIRRLGLALVAWPPLGLAAAAAIGDVTGCTSYAAACSGSDTILPWLAQAGILGLLLLLPPLARILVGGTIAVLVALVPVTALLITVGAGGASQAAFALGALLATAWFGGVLFAARGTSRARA